MRFVVAETLLEAHDRAIELGLSLSEPLDSRRAAVAVLVPHHWLVNRPETRTPGPWRWPVPQGAYELAHNGARTCTPEFTFLLMARMLDIPELALFGLELCSTYVVDWHDPRGFVPDCMPRTNTERIRSFIDHCGSAPGTNAARMALRWIADRSASPRESALVLLLCLPQRLGGFGLPMPELNVLDKTNANSRALVGHHQVFPDLYWRWAHFSLEFDSDEEHTGRSRIARDAKRRVVLAAMNIQSLTVTSSQLGDTEEMLKIARLTARALGRRIRRCNLTFRRRHTALRIDILGLTLPQKA